MNYTIGIALATFNGDKYLKAQLESILNQTVRPDIVSISDDASSDNTIGIVEEFRSRANFPVKVSKNASRLGVIDNFMMAFAQCHTDYISYCDQDDVWSPEKLSNYRKILALDNVSLIFHRSTIVDDNLNPMGRFEPFNIGGGCFRFPHFPDSLWGFGHQMIFSQKVLKALVEVQRAGSTVIADAGRNFDFALLLAAGMVGDIHFIDSELMQFRRHSTSVSPAGHDAPKARPLRTFDTRQENIQRTENLLRAILDGFSDGTFRPIECARTAPIYIEHLSMLHKIYSQRLKIYGSGTRIQRLQALLQLSRFGAYGSTLNNRLPLRQMLVDCMRCLS